MTYLRTFKNLALATTLSLSFLTSQALAQSGPMLTPAQIKSDIALAEEAYTRIHPGYTRYATDTEMAEAWDMLERRAEDSGGMSLGDFYLGVEKVLTQIRCDHTKAELPKTLIAARKEKPVYLPLRWSVIEGRGIIRITGEGTGLNFGDEIIAIDGRPLQSLMDEVAPYIPVDGYTEWSRQGGISESLEFRGGAVDHFGALLWDIKPQAQLTVGNESGERREVTIERVHFEDWSALGAVDGVTRNFKDAVSFERIGNNGAYLAVDTFVNYREPVDPDIIYDPIFDTLQEEGRDYLIVDLRQNGGGSSDAQAGLLNRIMTEKKAFSKDVRVNTLNLDGLRKHLWTWEKAAMKPNKMAFKKNKDGSYSFRKFAGQHGRIRPKKNGFKGQLIVLTSTSNSSASANILAHLKDSGRATLIGEKAGGSAEGPTAGIHFTLTLPESGIKTRIPVIRYFNNIKSFETGLSTSPDIYAPMTVKAFRERRDPALETAKALMKR